MGRREKSVRLIIKSAKQKSKKTLGMQWQVGPCLFPLVKAKAY